MERDRCISGEGQEYKWREAGLQVERGRYTGGEGQVYK